MNHRLSFFGIGPKIAVVTLTYAAGAGLATRLRPDVCLLRPVPSAFSVGAAAALFVIGFPMLVIAATSAARAYHSDQLATTGLFAIVRHPVYSAWIVFLLPGLAILSRSWPLLLMPLVAHVVFKFSIVREDAYLEERFGSAYLGYRARTNELIPIPRARRKAVGR